MPAEDTVTPRVEEVVKDVGTAEVTVTRVLANVGHGFAGQQLFALTLGKQLVSCGSNWLLNKTERSGSRLSEEIL